MPREIAQIYISSIKHARELRLFWMCTFLGSEMCLCELKLCRRIHFFDDSPCKNVQGDIFKCAFSFFLILLIQLGFFCLFVYSFAWFFFHLYF